MYSPTKIIIIYSVRTTTEEKKCFFLFLLFLSTHRNAGASFFFLLPHQFFGRPMDFIRFSQKCGVIWEIPNKIEKKNIYHQTPEHTMYPEILATKKKPKFDFRTVSHIKQKCSLSANLVLLCVWCQILKSVLFTFRLMIY